MSGATWLDIRTWDDLDPRKKVIHYVAAYECPDREADYATDWKFFGKAKL